MSATLEKGIRVLKEVIDAPMASYFSSCVHCGLCAEACLFYTETGDPKYTPIHKLEPLRRVYEQEYTLLGRLKKMAGLSKAVTDKELDEWQELVTTAARCAVAARRCVRWVTTSSIWCASSARVCLLPGIHPLA